jgi:hypothetical protein
MKINTNMNKLFLTTFLLGVLVFSSGAVLAVDANQSVEVTVGTDITVLISPNPLGFGSLPTGSIDAVGPNVTFNAAGSNVDVKVEVTNVAGIPFANGLKFNSLAPIGQDEILTCVVVSEVCTYSVPSWTTSLSIPLGTPAGLRSGAITYTVTGPVPSP